MMRMIMMMPILYMFFEKLHFFYFLGFFANSELIFRSGGFEQHPLA